MTVPLSFWCLFCVLQNNVKLSASFDLLQHHRDRLRVWRPDDEKTRTLRLLVEHRRRLVNDRTRFSNRLTAALKGYFPQVLSWFEDIPTRIVCDFLERWPQLSALQRASRF